MIVKPGGIAAGQRQTLNEAAANGIRNDHKNYGHGAGQLKH
jgi:hypothetical protein